MSSSVAEPTSLACPHLANMPISPFFVSVTHEFWHCIDLYYYHREAGISTYVCYTNFVCALNQIATDETYPTQVEKDCARDILNSLTWEGFRQAFQAEEDYKMEQRAQVVPERPLLWQRRRALTIQKLPVLPKP